MKYSGVIQKGQERGRALGYPTINIPCADKTVSGIYVARVYIKDEAPYRAAAFADPDRGVLEAHLLDFNDDVYGLEVTIELVQKIRDRKQFASDEELKQAIAADVAQVRSFYIE